MLAAAATGGLIGALGGAAIGGGYAVGAMGGAVAGGVGLAVISGVADARRRPGRPQPAVARFLAGAGIAAVAGWVVEVLSPWDGPVAWGAVFGAFFGMLGGRWRKIVLGMVIGALAGTALGAVDGDVHLSVVAAVTLLAYRTVALVLFRGQERIQLISEKVPATDLPFVVPLEARTRYVGVDYLSDYAERIGARFTRNPPDIGIIADLGALAGPTFDPTAVAPLITEFYEHTSRFRMTITPDWRPWMKPAYLLYRRFVARPLGQANAPFDLDEVQRGVVSWIDTIDLDHSGEVDVRAWVRAYEETGEPIYVGVYTVLRDDERGYVSVGFPLPSANFTATLLPRNLPAGGLLLESHTDLPYPGHYLTAVDPSGELSVVKLPSFGEEIEVWVDPLGELRTDHRFTLAGIRFMTLHYAIERHRAPDGTV